MERYEAYKDSGVEWVGEIPERWFAKRIKTLIHDLRVGPFGSAISTDDYVNEGIPLYTQETVLRDDWTIGKYITHEKSGALQSFIANPGDFLITTRGTLGHVYELPKTCEAGIIHPCLMRFRVNDDSVNGTFLKYALNDSDELIEQVLFASSSSTIPVLYSETLRNAYIAVPPIKQQQAIADYLDVKIDEVDALVADCEREVDLLQEYRKAIISEAVTKGLNPDAPMKDSGIEWIGEIPKGWKIVQLGRLCETRNGLDYDATQICTEDDDGATLVVRSGNIFAGKLVFDDCVYIRKEVPEQLQLRKGDVVIVRTNGSRELVGKSAYVAEDGIGTLGAFMLLCRSRYGRYICWLFQSDMLTYYMGAFSTSTVNQLSNGTVRGLHVPHPPSNVQDDICDYLDAKTAEIDSLIEAKQSMADKLREYRRSLISEAVTGKFKVPGL